MPEAAGASGEQGPSVSPPALIDAHAHLDYEQFADQLPQVLQRARDAGVVGAVTVATDAASSARALALAQQHPQLAATAGVHPHEAAKVEEQHWGQVERLLREPRVVAVGETGLDYYYDFSPREQQCAVFERQLRLAARLTLPVVIHVRDAYDDAFELIGRVGTPGGAVLHCFSGGPAECERALTLGLYVSLAGIVTFPKAAELREAATMVPADRLMVETDAPYLAPVPRRGRTNEPAYVAHTARVVAELRGEPLVRLAESTRRNTVRFFGLERVLPREAVADTVAP